MSHQKLINPWVAKAPMIIVNVNCNFHKFIRKANKRMYFLILLKRAWVPINDIVSFYSTCIRSVLEYCAHVFHHALPAYLSEELAGS